jgi:hypothetical protein
MIQRYIFPALALMALPFTGFAQNSVPSTPYRTLSYADVADMALAGKLAAQVRIRRATRIKGAQAIGVAADRKRFLVEADVLALIRGSESAPPRITYLIDLAADARGRVPRLDRGEAIIFANRVPGYPNEVRLVSPDAQLAATPENVTRIRLILSEANSDLAPPAITGISGAFYAQGNITGEGETQFFLDTETGKPVSITVAHFANAPPRWTISLGELVDQATPPPPRNTLLWYRLACFLPEQIPAEHLDAQEADIAALIKQDYALVKFGLGACPRSLINRPGR